MNHAFTPVILVHTYAAFAALALGAGVFLARKGTLAHRLAGRGWILLMVVTAVSAFWIKTSGSFSWIHGLSVLTLLGLAGAVYFAITRQIKRHRRVVITVYTSGLVIAGLFTLLPQRLIGKLLWTSLGLI